MRCRMKFCAAICGGIGPGPAPGAAPGPGIPGIAGRQAMFPGTAPLTGRIGMPPGGTIPGGTIPGGIIPEPSGAICGGACSCCGGCTGIEVLVGARSPARLANMF